MHIVRPVTEQIKKLGIHDRYNKIKRIVRIGNNDKHSCPLISKHIQLHLIIACQLPQLRNVKGSKPGSAGNQNGLRRFS